ncbi:hypothetical protein [Vibrio sp. D431a]|uniref:hypothetical protein n=1 Tax=Vibrio sp. D431a TaxID=2837388 RepID=UPI0025521789|nr:hypothetical protein [Vibrio sp. D431a]MDK9790683.1 hypothetical protein [Vibrio sp. D431a]
MFSFKVSNRIKFLHKIELLINSENGKKIVNSEHIPLIFRTDNVARQVGRLWSEDMNNKTDTHSLLVQGQFVMKASKNTLNVVVSRWKEQKIELGCVEIKQGNFENENIDISIKNNILLSLRLGALTA